MSRHHVFPSSNFLQSPSSQILFFLFMHCQLHVQSFSHYPTVYSSLFLTYLLTQSVSERNVLNLSGGSMSHKCATIPIHVVRVLRRVHLHTHIASQQPHCRQATDDCTCNTTSDRQASSVNTGASHSFLVHLSCSRISTFISLNHNFEFFFFVKNVLFNLSHILFHLY